eukprot:5607131-Pleurochrysis_carterae.AAC.1
MLTTAMHRISAQCESEDDRNAYEIASLARRRIVPPRCISAHATHASGKPAALRIHVCCKPRETGAHACEVRISPVVAVIAVGVSLPPRLAVTPWVAVPTPTETQERKRSTLI